MRERQALEYLLHWGQMAEGNEPTGKEPEALQGDAILGEAYAKTRKSLIAKLDNWEDQKAWDEFYQIYWRLIYSVAVKAGLRSDEAFDCVQETILSIAKQSKNCLLYTSPSPRD